MGFRTAEEVKESKYEGKFILQNDGDYADVVILYRNSKDVLVADTHYIKSSIESSYVHCLGAGCPACRKGLRVQTKLFVPLYVLNINGTPVNKILFWDRNYSFEPHLHNGVFKNTANPSEYVFRITRNGAFRSKDVTYSFALIANNRTPYDDILADAKIKMPDGYEAIVKDIDANIMSTWLNQSEDNGASSDLPDYVPMPRTSVSTGETNSAAEALIADASDEFELTETPDF